jgi:hypothetical protein
MENRIQLMHYHYVVDILKTIICTNLRRSLSAQNVKIPHYTVKVLCPFLRQLHHRFGRLNSSVVLWLLCMLPQLTTACYCLPETLCQPLQYEKGRMEQTTAYAKAIQLIFREGHYAVRKYMAGQWPMYTFAALIHSSYHTSIINLFK